MKEKIRQFSYFFLIILQTKQIAINVALTLNKGFLRKMHRGANIEKNVTVTDFHSRNTCKLKRKFVDYHWKIGNFDIHRWRWFQILNIRTTYTNLFIFYRIVHRKSIVSTFSFIFIYLKLKFPLRSDSALGK